MKRMMIFAGLFFFVVFDFCVSNPLPEPVITEYSTDPPWIEVFCFYVEPGDTIRTMGGIAIIEEVIPGPDYIVVLDSNNTTGFALNPEGDSIVLPAAPWWEAIGYGNLGNFGVPPLSGESAVAGYYRVLGPDSLHWNYELAYDFCPEPTPGEYNLGDYAGGAWGSSDVVINEINLHCTWAENISFIELYNRGDEPVDVGSLFLIGNARLGFPENLVVEPRGFLIIDEENFPEGFDLIREVDNLYLVRLRTDRDDAYCVLDQVGWSSDHGENVSFMRYPDGDCEDNFMGYNDYTSFSFENGFPSRGAPNRHQSPGFVVIGTRGSGGDAWVDLHWTNPIWDQQFDVSIAVRSGTGFPETPDDGIIVYEGDAQRVTDTEDLYPGQWYYYTVFARDLSGEYSVPTHESRDSVMLSSVGVIDDVELPHRIS